MPSETSPTRRDESRVSPGGTPDSGKRDVGAGGGGGGAAPSWAQSRIPCEMSSAGGQFHSDVNPLSAPELDVQKCLRW